MFSLKSLAEVLQGGPEEEEDDYDEADEEGEEEGEGAEGGDEGGEEEEVEQAVAGGDGGPLKSFWGVASALTATVKARTTEVLKTVQEVDWREELEAFQQGAKDDAEVVSKGADAVVHRAREAAEQLPASLEGLPGGAAALQRRAEAAAGAARARAGRGLANLAGLGSRLVLTTHDLFEQISHAVQHEMALVDEGAGSGSRRGSSQALAGQARYSRFEADVAAMQRDSSTYCDEPEDSGDYEAWLAGFDLAARRPDVERLIADNTFMSELQVPRPLRALCVVTICVAPDGRLVVCGSLWLVGGWLSVGGRAGEEHEKVGARTGCCAARAHWRGRHAGLGCRMAACRSCSVCWLSERARIVPLIVEYDAFWTRYFYRLHRLEQKHQAFQALAQRAQQGGGEEEVGWSSEEESEEGQQAQQQAAPGSSGGGAHAPSAAAGAAAGEGAAAADEEEEAAGEEAGGLHAAAAAMRSLASCSSEGVPEALPAGTPGSPSSAQATRVAAAPSASGTGSPSEEGATASSDSDHWQVVRSPRQGKAAAGGDAAAEPAGPAEEPAAPDDGPAAAVEEPAAAAEEPAVAGAGDAQPAGGPPAPLLETAGAARSAAGASDGGDDGELSDWGDDDEAALAAATAGGGEEGADDGGWGSDWE